MSTIDAGSGFADGELPPPPPLCPAPPGSSAPPGAGDTNGLDDESEWPSKGLVGVAVPDGAPGVGRGPRRGAGVVCVRAARASCAACGPDVPPPPAP